MAKTPADLALLVVAILIPEAKKGVPDGGYASVMKGATGWEGMRVGFVESTWGGGDKEKWERELIVSEFCKGDCDIS
jgi:hypothetical protein